MKKWRGKTLMQIEYKVYVSADFGGKTEREVEKTAAA